MHTQKEYNLTQKALAKSEDGLQQCARGRHRKLYTKTSKNGCELNKIKTEIIVLEEK